MTFLHLHSCVVVIVVVVVVVVIFVVVVWIWWDISAFKQLCFLEAAWFSCTCCVVVVWTCWYLLPFKQLCILWGYISSLHFSSVVECTWWDVPPWDYMSLLCWDSCVVFEAAWLSCTSRVVLLFGHGEICFHSNYSVVSLRLCDPASLKQLSCCLSMTSAIGIETTIILFFYVATFEQLCCSHSMICFHPCT